MNDMIEVQYADIETIPGPTGSGIEVVVVRDPRAAPGTAIRILNPGIPGVTIPHAFVAQLVRQVDKERWEISNLQTGVPS